MPATRTAAALAEVSTAVVIDFQAERAARGEWRLDAAAESVANKLAQFDAGLIPFSSVLAALVAPFNRG
jgi:hypothetical protein